MKTFFKGFKSIIGSGVRAEDEPAQASWELKGRRRAGFLSDLEGSGGRRGEKKGEEGGGGEAEGRAWY